MHGAGHAAAVGACGSREQVHGFVQRIFEPGFLAEAGRGNHVDRARPTVDRPADHAAAAAAPKEMLQVPGTWLLTLVTTRKKFFGTVVARFAIAVVRWVCHRDGPARIVSRCSPWRSSTGWPPLSMGGR